MERLSWIIQVDLTWFQCLYMKGLGGVESESEDTRMIAEVRQERKCHIGDFEDERAMSQGMWVTSEGAFPGHYRRRLLSITHPFLFLSFPVSLWDNALGVQYLSFLFYFIFLYLFKKTFPPVHYNFHEGNFCIVYLWPLYPDTVLGHTQKCAY